MKKILRTKRFEKDLKILRKRGKDINKLTEVLCRLVREDFLPQKYREHKLVGDYAGIWDCHIESDWLLLYEKNENSVTLRRTGTHSDLF